MLRGTDVWPAWEQRLSVVEKRQDQAEERQAIVEHRQVRFMKMWIATHLISRTSTPTAPTSPTSTGTSTATLLTAESATPPPKKGRLRAIAQYSKPVISYLIEKGIPILWGIVGPILLGLYASGREGLQLAWGWLLGTWTWLIG